ncbi:hypothetical protein FV250_26525 [Escherichia coli]|nr:hypothetical protein FV250_26525 [Escherichia coli]
MRTSLVTREEMIEAIEQHTSCISTRDIPGVIANYFMITKQLYRRKDKNAVHREPPRKSWRLNSLRKR